MGSTNWPSSRSASRIGEQRGARPDQLPMSLLCPRQKRARKRHRGGGGLAVPGPFKRIARAGGQKVTIRTAQRSFFAFSSEKFRRVRKFFRYSRNDFDGSIRAAER